MIYNPFAYEMVRAERESLAAVGRCPLVRDPKPARQRAGARTRAAQMARAMRLRHT